MRLLLILLCFFDAAMSYKILVYNVKFAHSHSNFVGNVADILVDAGHNATSLIPVLKVATHDGTTKSHIIHLDLGESVRKTAMEYLTSMSDFGATPYLNLYGSYHFGKAMGGMFEESCRAILQHTELIDKLRDEKYDVMMGENFDMCGVGLSHLIKPKSFISLNSMAIYGPQYDEFGIPPAVSYNPSSFIIHFDVHSMFDRISNIVSEFAMRLFFRDMRVMVEKVFKEKFGPEFPSMNKLSSDVAYVFTNSEPLLDFAPPTTSRVISIGGLGAKAPKKLDEYWEKILTIRERTVLISFGTVIPSEHLSLDKKKAILKTVDHFKDITFIWKYENLEEEFAKSALVSRSNLIMTKWTPQNDLLNHPRMAAFISHGGMGSCMEVALRAVPTLFVPFIGDQPKNAWAMEYNGLGKVLSKFDLAHADKIIHNLREILENERYRNNGKIVSQKLAGKPFSSRELLIKYTEYAAEFGPSKALRPQSCDMNLIEYHNLDILLVFLAVILLLVASLFHIVRKLGYRIALRKSEKAKIM